MTPIYVLAACVVTTALCILGYWLRLKLQLRRLTTGKALSVALVAEAEATMRRREEAQTQPLGPWTSALAGNGLNSVRRAGEVMVCSVGQCSKESSAFNWWCTSKVLGAESRTGKRPSRKLAVEAAERAALLFGWNVDDRPAPAIDVLFLGAEDQAKRAGCRLRDAGDDWFLSCAECGRQLAGGTAVAVAEVCATGPLGPCACKARRAS